MINAAETSNLPSFRRFLENEITELEPTVLAGHAEEYKALTFLNGVEVAHAELVDQSEELSEDFLPRNSRKTGQLISRLKKDILEEREGSGHYVGLFSQMEISLEMLVPSTQEGKNGETSSCSYATDKEQSSYEMFIALFGLKYLFN
jgi:hypothetical protein